MRDVILQEATRLFADHGYDGTSLQEIADAVGIRKPSLLYHFPSKQDLRQAVLEQLLARWNDVLPSLLQGATREERFDVVMAEMLSFFRADPDRARLLIREVLDRPQDMTDQLAGYIRPWLEVVVDYIRRDQEAGNIHPDADPEAYVVAIINLGVTAVGLYEKLALVLPGSDTVDESRQRQETEILRIARSSLFLPDSGRASQDSRVASPGTPASGSTARDARRGEP